MNTPPFSPHSPKIQPITAPDAKKFNHFIAGMWVPGESGETIASVNPATEQIFCRIQAGTQGDIDKAVAAAAACYASDEWQSLSYIDRADMLRGIADCIDAHAMTLAQIETLENGKPIKESSLIDIPESAKVFRTYASMVLSLKGETFPCDGSTFSYTQYEPYGVVGLIVPWNYPLLMAAWKLAPALAAGNCVVIKPSEHTSASLLTLCEFLAPLALPNGAINVVTGTGALAGTALTRHPGIARLSFTGSTATGKTILANAAQHITPCTVELGGKSATLIFKDVDINAVASTVLTTIFMNQGEMCVAGSRLLIDAEIYEPFLNTFARMAADINMDNGIKPTADMGPLISRAHQIRVANMVDRAVVAGAEKLAPLKERAYPKQGYYYPPTVLKNVTPEMEIWNEEVFGPVVAAAPFSGLKNAIELANRSRYGLAASVWSNNQRIIHQAVRNLKVGTVWVNTYGVLSPEVPFGGFNQSGYGKELGLDSLLAYCRKKSVSIDISLDAKSLISGWYNIQS